MKKTLKLTSLLFTLILAVSVVFTGCGNGRKDSTTKGTTENNNASATTEDNLVDDAEDAVDDVADGVGDAVDDIANGFDNYVIKNENCRIKSTGTYLHRNLYLTWNTFDLTFDLYVCSFP